MKKFWSTVMLAAVAGIVHGISHKACEAAIEHILDKVSEVKTQD